MSGAPLAGAAMAAALSAVLGALTVVAAGWASRPPESRPVPAGVRALPSSSSADSVALATRRPRWVGALGLLVGLGLAQFLVGTLITVVVVGGAGAAWFGVRRGAARRRELALDSAVPDLIDLFVIAASAGHTVAGCLQVVTNRSPLVLQPALKRAHHRVVRGVPIAVALKALGPELGQLGPALCAALITSAATGSAMGPSLVGVAATARDRRRRAAETAARRLPVTMLFPLVCCVLPAFALLAVVPLLAAALSSIRV